MKSIRDQFAAGILRSKEYRDGLREAELTVGLAFQLSGLRQHRGWTQEDLARRCGLSLRAISRLENGEDRPSIATLLRIAEAFDVHLTVRFERWGQLADWLADPPANRLTIPTAADDVTLRSSSSPG